MKENKSIEFNLLQTDTSSGRIFFRANFVSLVRKKNQQLEH